MSDKPPFNVQGAMAKLMTSKDGIATLQEIADAGECDITGGPPWEVPHPIFRLIASLEGVRQIDQGNGLLTRFQLSAIMRAPKGIRADQ